MVRLAANLSFLFKERPFLARFAAARANGFRAVEFMFPGDGGYLCSAADVRTELEAHGLTQVLLNAPAGDWLAGERGLGGLASREAEFRSSVHRGLEYAVDVSCSKMHVMAGLASGRDAEATFVERLQWASVEAASAGVTLCVEPLNPVDFPGYLVPDTPTALRILRAVGAPKAAVRLQLDLYHLAMVNGSATEGMARAVRELLPHAAHVQLASPPGRNEPGVGDLHVPPLLELLDELAYDGFVGCEYKPSRSTEQALEWARDGGYLPS